MAKKVFKRHQFGQIMLLPPSLDEMIDKNHPRVLLKVLVYAYLDGTISI